MISLYHGEPVHTRYGLVARLQPLVVNLVMEAQVVRVRNMHQAGKEIGPWMGRWAQMASIVDRSADSQVKLDTALFGRRGIGARGLALICDARPTHWAIRHRVRKAPDTSSKCLVMGFVDAELHRLEAS